MALKEKESTLLVGGILLALAAVAVKKILGNDDSLFDEDPPKESTDKKGHAPLAIPKDLLERYKKRNGSAILLRFDKPFAARTKLQFIGFNDDRDIIVREQLKDINGPTHQSTNIFFGDIFANDSNKDLHSLLMTTPLLNWTLTPGDYIDPERKMADPRYVSYILKSEGSFAEYRINPSPPARR